MFNWLFGRVRRRERIGRGPASLGSVQLPPGGVPGPVLAGRPQVRDDDPVAERHRQKGDGGVEAEVDVNELILLKVLPRVTDRVAAVLRSDSATSSHIQAVVQAIVQAIVQAVVQAVVRAVVQAVVPAVVQAVVQATVQAAVQAVVQALLRLSRGGAARAVDAGVERRRGSCRAHTLHEAVGDEVMSVETGQTDEDDGKAAHGSPGGEPPPHVKRPEDAQGPLHRHGGENPGGEVQRGVQDEQVNLAAGVGEASDVVVEGVDDPIAHGPHGEDDAVGDGEDEHVHQGGRLAEVQSAEDDDHQQVAEQADDDNDGSDDLPQASFGTFQHRRRGPAHVVAGADVRVSCRGG